MAPEKKNTNPQESGNKSSDTKTNPSSKNNPSGKSPADQNSTVY